MKYDIFISYSRRDTAIVNQFADKFSQARYKYWMDVDGIEIGDEFKRKIVSAIKESKVFLFFSSEASNSSSWTVKEVNVAVILKKPIIPIKLDNAVYDDSLLFDLVGLDFIECSSDDKVSSGIQKLMRSLKNKIGPGNNGGSEDEPDAKEPTDPATLKDIDEFLAMLESGKVKTVNGERGDDDETVVVPVISNDSEKSQALDDGGETVVAFDNSSSTPEGEVSRSDVGENADPAAHVIPTKRSAEESQFTDEEILDSVQDDKGAKKEKSGNGNEKSAVGVISNDSEKSQNTPFYKKLIAIVAVPLLFVTVLIFGVNWYGDYRAAEAERRQAEIALAEQQAEQQRLEAERLAAEHEAKENADRKAKEEAYSKGLAAYKKNDYPEAVKWYRKAAEQGNATAQFDLGYCYKNGEGVEQSYVEAVKWYRKSAEQGYAAAQCNLGYCYKKGEGVEQSHEEAAKWYRKAAEQGNAVAQCCLGYFYENGEGVEQSSVEAVKWYRKAVEQGNATAQCNLGYCYKKGQGVEQSHVEAVKWYRKSAEQGNAAAQFNLGYCYEKGEGVEQSYAEAVKWYRKAAEQGNASAQFNLALCYEKDQGVTQSYSEAAKWYRKAAEQGDQKAKAALERLGQ